MGRRPSAKRVAAEAGAHLLHSEAWQGIRTGDPVDVSETGLTGASWTFRCHVLNLHNGAEWVEVVGGRPGASTVRSFDPQRIYAGSGRRRGTGTRGRLPLTEEPRLPLG